MISPLDGHSSTGLFPGGCARARNTSLVSLFNTVALAYLLRREIGGGEGRRIALTAGRVVACTAALAAVAAVARYALRGFAKAGFVQALAVLLLAVAASGAVYGVAARLVRLEELGLVWGLLRRRVRRSRAVPSGPGTTDD